MSNSCSFSGLSVILRFLIGIFLFLRKTVILLYQGFDNLYGYTVVEPEILFRGATVEKKFWGALIIFEGGQIENDF